METVSLFLVFFAYIGIRLLLGHHKTPEMKDRQRFKSGIQLVYQKKYLQAIAYFEAQVKQNPQSGLAWTFKAECHLELGEYYTTIVCANNALKIDQHLRDNYIIKGKAFYKLAEYRDAWEEFNKAVWYFREKHPEAFYYRGLCAYELGRETEAEYDFKRAVKLGDEDANLFLLKIKNKYNIS